MTPAAVPRRQRRGNPKVRTGCATCKIRKVKCDETRPYCLRCVNFGRTCDGYEPGLLKPPPHAPLLAIKPRPTMTLSIYQPKSLLSDDPEEQRYFQFYCDHIATDISGPFQSEFWYRIVPQAAQNEPAIRHAATAISALMRMANRKTICSLELESKSTQDPHLKFALLQYNRAIKNLQSRIQSMPSHRVILISSLLFSCIDVLQGDRVTAMRQVMGGINVLCNSRPWTPTMKPNVTKPWNSEPIEDELWQMLTTLNVHAYMLLGAQHPHHGTQYTEREKLMIYPPIPVRFANLTEAKVSLDLVLSGIPMFHEREKDDPLAEVGPACDYNRKRDYDENRKRLDCWESAYEPFLESMKSMTSTSSRIQHGECVLPVVHKLAVIILEAGRNQLETNYDRFHKEFKYIVTNSRQIIEYRLKHQKIHSPTYSFDAGLLPSLHLTASKCRDPELRREAIRLLYIYPQQEGMWNGYDSARICEWMMSLEEAEKDENGFIPEKARVRLIDMACDLEKKRVALKCVNVVPNQDGTPRTRVCEYFL